MMAGWGGGGAAAAPAAPVGGGIPEEEEAEAMEDRADVLKLVLYELNSAISPRQHRLAAIRAVLSEFDHADEFRHDEELDLHADRILFQRLAFAFSVEGGPGGEEAGLVAGALEMAYRASRARVALSFNEVGEAMLPLLVEMVRDPDPHRRRRRPDHRPGRQRDARSAAAGTGDRAGEGSAEARAALERLGEIAEGEGEVKRAPSAAKSMYSSETPLAGNTVATYDDLNGGGVNGGDYDGYYEEKKGDSMENLEHAAAGLGGLEGGFGTSPAAEERKTGWAGGANGVGGAGAGEVGRRGGVEVETVCSEENEEEDGDARSRGGDSRAADSKLEWESLARFGNDHASHCDEHAEQQHRRGHDDDDGRGRASSPSKHEQRPQVRFSEDLREEFPSDGGEPETSPLAVSRVLKVLRYFSRVLSAMIPMAHHPGLLDALVYQLGRRPRHGERYTIDDEEPEEYRLQRLALESDLASIRIDAMATLVNLACAEENKILMVHHAHLLDAILHAADYDPSEEAREHAAIVLMNLAYAEENKVHMAGRDELLDTLVKLVGDPSPFTRRYASAALFTLACVSSNTSRMAGHSDGAILTALVGVLLNDPIDEARINSAEALFNMARNNDDEEDGGETVDHMGSHPQLLGALAQSVVSDYSADVRAYAARTLEWLSADIHHPLPYHPTLLSSLVTASRWTKTTCVAEAFKIQSTVPTNRPSMVQHPGLLDALADLALLEGIDDEEVSACAITAIERLSKEVTTRGVMVKNEGVMTALTRATFSKSGLDDGGHNGEEDLLLGGSGSGDDLDALSLTSGVSTSQLTKNALKNLADAM